MKKFVEWLKRHKFSVIALLLLFLVVFPFFSSLGNSGSSTKELKYEEFQTMLSEGHVKKVAIDLSNPTFTLQDDKGDYYYASNPKTETFKENLLKKGVDVTEIDPRQAQQNQAFFRSILNTVIMIVIFIVAMTWIQKKMGANKKNEIAADEMPKINFSQIAGNDEAKDDMKFLVDFLKNPKRYKKMGAKLPKGVIFYGPPGTGKTLTAKAIAGEAGVPFFSLSGSDFVEMFVGLGASRVRDLFKKAREKAPCIIFIDEIDAIGGKRDMDMNSERKQTLNALLAELDGFGSNEGIIVIGATNRLEDLDPAFIRPGRFDKHIAIELPDQKGRYEILKVHAKNKPLGTDVDLLALSKMTTWFSGASLEMLLNEAAILAATRNKEVITMEEIDDAYFKTLMKGHKKKSGNKRDIDEIKLVAWHEAGHAVAAKIFGHSEVPKVTIIASTSGAGGVTFITPKKSGLFSKQELMDDVKVSYAGRVAEYLLLGDDSKITTGASQDIKMATDQIRAMINDYGMGKMGMVNLDRLDQRNNSLTSNKAFVDEVSTLSNKLYQETLQLLTDHKDTLQAVAEALIEKETLTDEELNTIIQSTQRKKTISNEAIKNIVSEINEKETLTGDELQNIIERHQNHPSKEGEREA